MGDQIRRLGDGQAVGVDAEIAEAGAVESVRLRGGSFRDPPQVSLRPAGQRVAWLGPAQALPAKRDAARQLCRTRVQSAHRDAGPRQRAGVHRGGASVRHGPAQDEPPRPGLVVGPPQVREVTRRQLGAVRGRRTHEADLVQVDVGRGDPGPQLPQEHLEGHRGLADAGDAAGEQDLTAGTCRRTGRCPGRGRRQHGVGRPGTACPGGRPSAAAFPHQPGHLGDGQAIGVDAHVREGTTV